MKEPDLPITSLFVYLFGVFVGAVKNIMSNISFAFLINDEEVLSTMDSYLETAANVLMVISFLVVIFMNLKKRKS